MVLVSNMEGGAVVVQDDRREREMRELFGLLPGGGREGVDAYLKLDGQKIPFELKSTTTSSFSTVRDLGHDHIEKWRTVHWLFSVYDKNQRIQYSLYGSPAAMEPWIAKMGKYIGPDFMLAELVPNLITMDEVFKIVGKKDLYTLEDARRLHKSQYSMTEYRQQMDKPAGYSQARMLSILRDRCRYIIERGSTLNNPHIPIAYFAGWEKIKNDHAKRLKALVRNAQAKK